MTAFPRRLSSRPLGRRCFQRFPPPTLPRWEHLANLSGRRTRRIWRAGKTERPQACRPRLLIEGWRRMLIGVDRGARRRVAEF